MVLCIGVFLPCQCFSRVKVSFSHLLQFSLAALQFRSFTVLSWSDTTVERLHKLGMTFMIHVVILVSWSLSGIGYQLFYWLSMHSHRSHNSDEQHVKFLLIPEWSVCNFELLGDENKENSFMSNYMHMI